METSERNNLISVWFLWHFYEMPEFLLGVWKNYILFALNYFSLPILLKSFFAPWRRYKWSYPKGFDVGGFFSTLISNIFSRVLGALMRIVLIIAGIMLQIFVVIAGLIIIAGWLITPLIIVLGFLCVLFY